MIKSRAAVLMCTYNGASFLWQQLDSLASQSYSDWALWVSDDGSFDNTSEIIKTFSENTRQPVMWLNGPCQGFCRNFLSLLRQPQIVADYYFFSDQDDVWHPDKMSRAIHWLQQQPANQPALYCSRTRLIDEAGQPLGYSPLFSRTPAFANAMVQSVAGGNTMAMNDAMRRVLVELSEGAELRSHDWWAYIVATAVGAVCYYDPETFVDYRQHENNQVGSNKGVRAIFSRLQLLLLGEFSSWNKNHIEQLERHAHLLTPSARRQLFLFKQLKTASLACRLGVYRRGPFYRQTLLGNAGLLLAVLLKRL